MAADETTANLTRGSYSVDITFSKLEHAYDKNLIILDVPKEKSATGKNATPLTSVTNPLVYIIDIQRLKQVITITGLLLDEKESSALTKIDQLESIMSGSGEVTLTWKVGSTTITKYGNIIKTTITEAPGRIGDSFLTGVTTSTSSGKLVDSNATFSTEGVAVDASVVNITDNTFTRVSSIDSETQLTLDTDIFTSGESYQVGLSSKTQSIMLQFGVGTFRG